MARIIASQKYLVNTAKGRFKIYVSRHSDGNCYGGLLWYKKSGSWAEGQAVNVDFEFENFLNSTEERALQEAVDWVKKNLDPDAEVTLGE